MAVNSVSAVVERRAESVERPARRVGFSPLRNLRHGAPAASYSERNRDFAISRSDADRILFEAWGWA